MRCVHLALAFALASAPAPASASPKARDDAPFDPASAGYELHWAETTIDHFNWQPQPGGTFRQRYYVLDTHWDRDTGPILFCEQTRLRPTRTPHVGPASS